MPFVDMHIHSVYSDGTYPPEEIVRRAVENGAGLISVCDHNAVEGTLAAAPLARMAGLDYVHGVEIDAAWLGMDVHVLCYGADLADPALARLIREARLLLDEMSDRLLVRMQRDYPALNMEEYRRMPHDPSLGGWKLLKYLWIKGVSRDLKDGFRFYDAYGVGYGDAGFQPVAGVIEAIHGAGGRAVLAHPGVTLAHRDLDDFRARLRLLLAEGFDGVECHYPRHSRALTRACLEECRARALMVTAGSDCHGAFGRHIIAETRTERDQMRLDGLTILRAGKGEDEAHA